VEEKDKMAHVLQHRRAENHRAAQEAEAATSRVSRKKEDQYEGRRRRDTADIRVQKTEWYWAS